MLVVNPFVDAVVVLIVVVVVLLLSVTAAAMARRHIISCSFRIAFESALTSVCSRLLSAFRIASLSLCLY